MLQCHYCLEYKVEDSAHFRPQPNKLLQFPDGQKIAFRNVCFDCNHVRLAWQKQIDAEKLQIAAERRQWHLDVAKRNAQKRAEIEARRVEREQARAIAEQQREASRQARSAVERELALAKIAKLETELEALRKKYFSQT